MKAEEMKAENAAYEKKANEVRAKLKEIIKDVIDIFGEDRYFFYFASVLGYDDEAFWVAQGFTNLGNAMMNFENGDDVISLAYDDNYQDAFMSMGLCHKYSPEHSDKALKVAERMEKDMEFISNFSFASYHSEELIRLTEEREAA